MTPTALPPEWIAAAVFERWRDALASDAPTIYPGLHVDTSAWPEWFELWLDSWSPRRQRSVAPELTNLLVTAHCFVRPATDAGRVLQLAAAAQQALNRQTLAIADPAAREVVVGYAKFTEADVRDVTRLEADAGRHGLQHHVVTWHGWAQRV